MILWSKTDSCVLSKHTRILNQIIDILPTTFTIDSEWLSIYAKDFIKRNKSYFSNIYQGFKYHGVALRRDPSPRYRAAIAKQFSVAVTETLGLFARTIFWILISKNKIYKCNSENHKDELDFEDDDG